MPNASKYQLPSLISIPPEQGERIVTQNENDVYHGLDFRTRAMIVHLLATHGPQTLKVIVDAVAAHLLADSDVRKHVKILRDSGVVLQTGTIHQINPERLDGIIQRLGGAKQ